MGIADIRKIEAGATRSVRDFERALKTVQKRMVRAAQIEGRKVFKKISRRFEKLAYANAAGRVKKLKKFGEAHKARKKQLRLDPRRGHMRKGIAKQIKSPKAFIKRRDGFIIDLEKPALTITGRATLRMRGRNLAGRRVLGGSGKARGVVAINIINKLTDKRSFLVNRYIGHYADQKAPGLGSITKADVKRLERKILEAAEGHLVSIIGGTRVLGGDAAARIELKIGRLFA